MFLGLCNKKLPRGSESALQREGRSVNLVQLCLRKQKLGAQALFLVRGFICSSYTLLARHMRMHIKPEFVGPAILDPPMSKSVRKTQWDYILLQTHSPGMLLFAPFKDLPVLEMFAR